MNWERLKVKWMKMNEKEMLCALCVDWIVEKGLMKMRFAGYMIKIEYNIIKVIIVVIRMWLIMYNRWCIIEISEWHNKWFVVTVCLCVVVYVRMKKVNIRLRKEWNLTINRL